MSIVNKNILFQKKIISSVNKRNRPFVFLVNNHGLWEVLHHFKLHNIFIKNLSNEKYFKQILNLQIKNDFYFRKCTFWSYEGIQKFFSILKKKINNDFVFYKPELFPIPKSDVLSGTPVYGIENCKKIINEMNHIDNIKLSKDYNGYVFREMIINSRINSFIKNLRREKVILVANSDFKSFSNLFDVKIFHIEIDKYRGIDYLEQYIENIKKKILNENYNILLLSCGYLAFLIYDNLKDLVFEKKLKIYDIGNTFQDIVLEGQQTTLIKFYRNKIINTLKKLNAKKFKNIIKKNHRFLLNQNYFFKNHLEEIDNFSNYKKKIKIKKKTKSFNNKKISLLLKKILSIPNFRKLELLTCDEFLTNKFFKGRDKINLKILLPNNHQLFNSVKSVKKIYIDTRYDGLICFDQIKQVPINSWDCLVYDNFYFNKTYLEAIRNFCILNNKIFISNNSDTLFQRLNDDLSINEIEVIKLTGSKKKNSLLVIHNHLTLKLSKNNNNMLKNNLNELKSFLAFADYLKDYIFFYRAQKRRIVSLLNSFKELYLLKETFGNNSSPFLIWYSLDNNCKINSEKIMKKYKKYILLYNINKSDITRGTFRKSIFMNKNLIGIKIRSEYINKSTKTMKKFFDRFISDLKN